MKKCSVARAVASLAELAGIWLLPGVLQRGAAKGGTILVCVAHQPITLGFMASGAC